MNRCYLPLVVFFGGLFFCTVTWSQKISTGNVNKEIREYAYRGQEILKYEISWSGGIKIGDLHMEIRKKNVDEDTYTIHARVKDSGIFHFFYPVNDTFDTVVTGDNRLPIHYNVEQKEGSSYHALRYTEYDQKKGVIRYQKNNKEFETFQVAGEVHNEFSSFLYTRILELDKSKPVIVPTFADKKRHEVVVRTGNRISIESKLFGTVNVLPITPIMAFKGLYDKAGDTVIFYSDDLCRIPVRINSKILVGSITAELISYSSSTCLQYSSHHPDTPQKPAEKVSLKIGD
jgi:Protein of unknown function (DUF3108)